MKYFLRITVITVFIIIGAVDAMAIEEADYEVIKKDKNFEIRDYAPHILAETIVEGNLQGAGNKAFSRLFRYISGNNAYFSLSGTSLQFVPAPQYGFIRHFIIGAKRRSKKLSRVPDGTRKTPHFEHTLFQ